MAAQDPVGPGGLGTWASGGRRGAPGASTTEGLTRGDRPVPDGRPRGLRSRSGWLTAPRSTVAQPRLVHTGLTEDPDAEADRLLQLLVLPVER